jgi:hypothetical protein
MLKRRTLSIAALTVMLITITSACATPTETTNEPAPTATKIIVDYGDVLPSGKYVEATDGKYETVSFDKNNTLYTKVQLELMSDEVETFGFSEEEVLTAQQDVLNILVKDYIDNPAVGGNSSEYKTWVESLNNTNKYDSTIVENLLAATEDKTSEIKPTTLVLTRTDESILPIFVKDGKPRMSDVKVELKEINATEYEKKPYLEFKFTYVTDYRVSDKAVIDASLKASGLKNKEQLRGVLDEKVFDNESDNAFTVNSDVNFGIQKSDDGWKIVTVDSEYSFDESDYKLTLTEE